ncbi:MAG: transcriptional regulator TbsP [Haloarculaceae archaeon]
MSDNLLRTAVADVFRDSLSTLDGTVYVVNPTKDAIDELVSVLEHIEDAPEVRLLARAGALKDSMEDFLVASTAADLVESGTLALRVSDDRAGTLLVGEDRVVSVVGGDDGVGGLVGEDADLVATVRDRYDAAWEAAEAYTLRTPPIDDVRTTLEDDLGPETAADFDGMLASLETARGDGEGLDEVTISLLVAAKNEQLLYDISKWGEDVGIASKATFSRTKSRLEELGLIDTEKVPIDVGRPRLRLLLGDERLKGAETDQIASVAQSILAN